MDSWWSLFSWNRWFREESDTHKALRRFFEVDAESIALAVLYQLARHGNIEFQVVQKTVMDLGIDPEKSNPLYT